MLAAAVPPDASVRVQRCQVTSGSLSAASRELDLGAFSLPFPGIDGALFCDGCHILFTNTVRSCAPPRCMLCMPLFFLK